MSPEKDDGPPPPPQQSQGVKPLTFVGLEALNGVTKVSYTPTMPYVVLEEWKLTRNYQISDQAGKKIYHGGEKVKCHSEALLQGYRPFLIYLFNSSGDMVVKMEQKCSCRLCFFRAECAGAKVKILLPTGECLGSISQIFTCCTPTYEVLDSQENRIMMIVGKCCRVCFRLPAKSFRVFADVKRDDEVTTEIVATIGRRYVDLKDDMSVDIKCLLVGAMFLIEMDYFRSWRGKKSADDDDSSSDGSTDSGSRAREGKIKPTGLPQKTTKRATEKPGPVNSKRPKGVPIPWDYPGADKPFYGSPYDPREEIPIIVIVPIHQRQEDAPTIRATENGPKKKKKYNGIISSPMKGH